MIIHMNSFEYGCHRHDFEIEEPAYVKWGYICGYKIIDKTYLPENSTSFCNITDYSNCVTCVDCLKKRTK